MFISPNATRLFAEIENYLKESSKKEYNFTIEEQQQLGKYINILDNQYKMLVNYELKKLEEQQKQQKQKNN